ncbi:hypothetical protein TNCV_1964691 [Trichonephila clavipes]|nr:hypothetical protein TNCV_1964691 [Trichonephila clavipes]
MPQSGGQFEVRPPVFKSPSKLGTHLSTHCRSFCAILFVPAPHQEVLQYINFCIVQSNHQVAYRVAKNDANLALLPILRLVSIESTL